MNVRAFLVPVVVGIGLIASRPAAADPVKCSRTIVKQYGKYVAFEAKILDKCKKGVITKGEPTTLAGCPDSVGAGKIAKAASKLKTKIAKKCGGPDKTCDGAGDDSLSSINWNISQCMGFEANPGCFGIALADCGDIADCLICIGDSAVEQGVDGLLYDRFDSTVFFPNNTTAAAKATNKCQVEIAKRSVKFFKLKTKALNKCWDKKLKGKAGFAGMTRCPDTDPDSGSGNPPASPGDNKTVEKIKKAEQKKIAGICKACGAGGDSNKDGICDAPPGFALGDFVVTPFSCPTLRVPANAVHPAGENCGSINVTDLQSYINCIDCIIEFKADCVTDAGVGDNTPSQGIDYPFECTIND